MSNGTVTRIEPASDHAPYFTVHVDTPSSPTPASLTARKVILGTGLRDLLPDTPGVRENWGRGIYWCPWCDGHEHADQPLGLLGPLDDVAGMVREILTLNTDLYALVNGTDTPGVRAAAETAFPQWREYLQIQNVTVDNRTITRVERLRDGVSGAEDPSLATVTEHDLFRVDFAEGPSVERAAFFVSFKDEQRSLVGPDLGVQMYAGRMAGNQSQGFQTNVEGVYAIGDANADNSTNVPHALYTGKRAAVFIQGKFLQCQHPLVSPRGCNKGCWVARLANDAAVQLERENGVVELAAADAQMQRRSIHEEARSLWERMNGEAGDILYAGDFEQ